MNHRLGFGAVYNLLNHVGRLNDGPKTIHVLIPRAPNITLCGKGDSRVLLSQSSDGEIVLDCQSGPKLSLQQCGWWSISLGPTSMDAGSTQVNGGLGRCDSRKGS